MRAFGALLALALVLAPLAGRTEGPERPIVVELFTSQGCSSCPPADALLRELARSRSDVLALAFHVTYWDRLGWPDPYALPASTERQRGYGRISHTGGLYTPQMVVDGTRDVVGSDRAAVQAALRAARAEAVVAVRVHADGAQARIDMGAGAGAGRVWLIGYDTERVTAVARGENAGRRLVEANIVRGVTLAGEWTGQALRLALARPNGERLAVIVQAADGRILGAAREG